MKIDINKLGRINSYPEKDFLDLLRPKLKGNMSTARLVNATRSCRGEIISKAKKDVEELKKTLDNYIKTVLITSIITESDKGTILILID